MKKVITLLLLMPLGFYFSWSQTKDISEDIKSYLKIPQEVVYLHLNKSTYIKGEDIGFTAYLLDKKRQIPSEISKNLYLIIENENKERVHEELLKITDGIAFNAINIDSNYTSGYYTIKAFTNWMRNFKDRQYFEEKIRIIDPKKEKYITEEVIDNSIDAQFMPESGHLLANIQNTVGVIIKDVKGFGVPDIYGEVYGENDLYITNFETNQLGIGRFPITPKLGEDYTIKIKHLNKDFKFKLNHDVEPIGVVLSSIEKENKLNISIKTNTRSQKLLKNKKYSLFLHNQSGVLPFRISFKESNIVTKIFDIKSLPVGINIFTLFDEKNNPVSERIVFNYNSIQESKIETLTTERLSDSLKLNFRIDQLNPDVYNTMSISILPQSTKCYNRHNNILSYNLIQPYVKGYVEQGDYYFTNINNKKKYDLDNLLITQGWSSFDWSSIFHENTIKHPAEQGITIKANINSTDSKKTEGYMVKTNDKEKPHVIKTVEGQKSFTVNNVFIEEGEKVSITKIKKNSGLEIPKLYLQLFPNRVPDFNTTKNTNKAKEDYSTKAYLNNNYIRKSSMENIQKLNEVVVLSEWDKARIRARELTRNSWNEVNVVTESERNAFFTLEDFIRTKGVQVDQNRASVVFYLGRNITLGGVVPMAIFIDDSYIGTSLPPRFVLMNNVDYIEINKTGLGSELGGTFRSSGGTIRVYSGNRIYKKDETINKQEYELPLTFSADKKFYVPKYQYYNDEFYNNYGTIDWKPKISSDEFGNISFKIKNPNVPTTLFIEGIMNNGKYVYLNTSIPLN